MGEAVDDFAYIWTSQRESWAVLRHGGDDVGLPYNRMTQRALMIDEDDALATAVVRRMGSEGMPVITSPD